MKLRLLTALLLTMGFAAPAAIPRVLDGHVERFATPQQESQDPAAVKYWDGWWKRLDRAAENRIRRQQLRLGLRGPMSGSCQYKLTVWSDGTVGFSVLSTNNPQYASMVEDSYRSLAHGKLTEFPPWSSRESVQDERLTYLTFGPAQQYHRTGDAEVVTQR